MNEQIICMLAELVTAKLLIYDDLLSYIPARWVSNVLYYMIITYGPLFNAVFVCIL